MEFPAKVGKKFVVQIPKNIRDFEELEEGDKIVVSIQKKDSIDRAKVRLERIWATQ